TGRRVVSGGVLVPGAMSVVGFVVFGGAAIGLARAGVPVAVGGAEAQTFNVLAELPFTGITSAAVMALVAIFFVSGADAASLVMGTLSQRGSIAPSRWVVVFWGAMTGAGGAVLVGIGGRAARAGMPEL